MGLDGSGRLRITAQRDSRGRWTSARIESRRADFKAPPRGILRVEARLRLPRLSGRSAAGYWPAFWMLGSPYRGHYWNWPGIGEFDIMENVNGLHSVWGVLHCGSSPGGPCNEPNGLGVRHRCPAGACQASFHTYRLEWGTAHRGDGPGPFPVGGPRRRLGLASLTDPVTHVTATRRGRSDGFPDGRRS